MTLYLGLDSSTQSLTAIVLEVEGDRTNVVFESSLLFDEALRLCGRQTGCDEKTDLVRSSVQVRALAFSGIHDFHRVHPAANHFRFLGFRSDFQCAYVGFFIPQSP